jgi:NitT/TauT family transport system ATP-binding protein
MKIVIKNLSMNFIDRRKTLPRALDNQAKVIPVLENINLTINEGEFVCIVGPSGCGKSTLLNVVGGFLSPSSGEALVDGKAITGPDPKRIFIFQENSVFPWLTVEENIGFSLLNKTEKERQEIVTHYINMVGLTGFEKSYPRELSGGMRQRAEIARALAADPDVIYMDEPFGALDFLTRLKMRAELVQIWQREQKTILFVTHDVEESVQLSDRVVVMSRRPATIHSIVDIPLPRPRDIDSSEYLALRDHIFHSMGLNHLGTNETKDNDGNKKTAPKELNKLQPTPTLKYDTDVIIIGGGPAGAILSTYLAKANIKSIIVEKHNHPREHVGESLSYSTCNILKEIDFLPVMERGDFLIKKGVCWNNHDSADKLLLSFDNLGEFAHTYQVDRAKFDHLLLEHAQKQGVQLISGISISEVLFGDNGFANGVKLRLGNSDSKLFSKLVVDASGRQTLLARQLQELNIDEQLCQFAISSWFRNVDSQDSKQKDFTQIYLLPSPRSWIWQIPISSEVTSVGIVTDKNNFPKDIADREDFFYKMIKLNPNLEKTMLKAERIRDWELNGNYSYTTKHFTGDGWLAVGDAAFFVDPIFSSGLSIAMHSSKFASETIIAALAQNNLSKDTLFGYEEKMRFAEEIWRKFVKLFYRFSPNFSHVIADEQLHSIALQLCEGYVYDKLAQSNLEKIEKIFLEAVA